MAELSETMRTPVPDPTALTTQQLYREIALLQAVLETRLAAVADKMLDLETGIKDTVDEKVSHLQLLHEEKFRSVEKQFLERDVRADEGAKSSKVAVDAALQAAKEAVEKQNASSSLAISKSETATSEQLKQLQQLIAATSTSLDDKISDLKERLTRMEGQGIPNILRERVTSIEGHGAGMNQMWAYGFAVLMLIVAIAAVVAAFLKK